MTLHYSFSLSKLLRRTNVVYGSKHRQIGEETEALCFYKCFAIAMQSCSNERVFKRISTYCTVCKHSIPKMFIVSSVYF